MGEGEKLALLVLTFGFAFLMVAYEDYADRKEEMYRDKTSFLSIFAFIGMIAAPVAAVILLSWWTVFIVVVAGFFAGLTVIRTFKAHSQMFAPVGLTACWVADILFVLP